MPITAGAAMPAFTVYYSLAGNNNDRLSPDYRPNNPWQIARAFCIDAAVARAGTVAMVTSLDDSVFQVILHAQAIAGATVQALATAFLNDLAADIAPPMNGDNLVAVVPDNGLLKQIVHHTP